jgi:hypothetical protein
MLRFALSVVGLTVVGAAELKPLPAAFFRRFAPPGRQ